MTWHVGKIRWGGNYTKCRQRLCVIMKPITYAMVDETKLNYLLNKQTVITVKQITVIKS